MTFTSDDLIPLKQALLSGTKQVSMNGRTVVFQDLAELKKLISEIENNIAANAAPAGTTPTNPNKITASFSK